MLPVSVVSGQFPTPGTSDRPRGITETVDRVLQTTAGRFEWLTVVFGNMADGRGCPHNCSGHGSCDSGQCVCMVRRRTVVLLSKGNMYGVKGNCKQDNIDIFCISRQYETKSECLRTICCAIPQ